MSNTILIKRHHSFSFNHFRAFIAFLFICLANTVYAIPISYSSFTGTVIDFDSLTGSATLGAGEVLTNQYSSAGAIFSVPNFDAYATNGGLATYSSLNSDPNVIWIDQGGGVSGTPAFGMNIDFSAPVDNIGMYVSNSFTSTTTLSVFNNATLLESITLTLPSSFTPGLEGFIALSNSHITRAVISSMDPSGRNWNFAIDDLKFSTSVPEPPAIALMALGLIGLSLARKNRSQA